MRVTFAHQNTIRIVPLLPFMGVDLNNNKIWRAMTIKPTRTDVLLGRGVATNRHPGNENFRAIVSHYVVSSNCRGATEI